jgi:hypothetical protein
MIGLQPAGLEADQGIGGGVAEIVGQLLQRLGASRQVLVITHLPQVAAQGAHHLVVSKTTSNGQTLSHIAALDEALRVEEIARMLGGVEINHVPYKGSAPALTDVMGRQVDMTFISTVSVMPMIKASEQKRITNEKIKAMVDKAFPELA